MRAGVHREACCAVRGAAVFYRIVKEALGGFWAKGGRLSGVVV